MSGSIQDKAMYWWQSLPKVWKQDYAKKYGIKLRDVTVKDIINFYIG